MKLMQLLVAVLVPGSVMAAAGEVKTQVMPNRPIVITADAKDIFGRSVFAPWFSFRPSMSNKTDSTVTVLGLKLKVHGRDSSGKPATMTKTYTPSDFPWTKTYVTNGTTQVYTCQFTHFGEFAPGAQDEGYYLAGDASCAPCDANGNPPVPSSFCVPRPLFYFSTGPGGVNGELTTWNAQLEAVGWFGSYDKPSTRFKNLTKFETQ